MRDTGSPIHIAKGRGSFVAASRRRQREHGWASPAEADPEHRRMIDRERFDQPWHEGTPCRLVPAILHRLADVLVFSRLQRADEQQRALQVGDGVAEGHG